MSNLSFSLVYVTYIFLTKCRLINFNATDRTQVEGAREGDVEEGFEPAWRK
jgi:hypothetical protein